MKRSLLFAMLAMSVVSHGAETNAPLPNYWTKGKPGHPPAGMEVGLVADRTNYFLGENILLHYRIHNASINSFNISVGGDYRGSSRADRFVVTAFSANGATGVPADLLPPGWTLNPR